MVFGGVLGHPESTEKHSANRLLQKLAAKPRPKVLNLFNIC